MVGSFCKILSDLMSVTFDSFEKFINDMRCEETVASLGNEYFICDER